MASWVFSLSKVMRDTSEHLLYLVNFEWRNDKYGWSYVSFGDVCFEIEFTKACFGKIVITLRKIIVIRIYVKDMKNTHW